MGSEMCIRDRTQVLVVCAGAKSILDLGLTLEYLETKGVPVIGYRTKELPAFYTTHSGFQVDYRLDTPKEIADAFAVKLDMGLAGGMLVTNPIPDEYAMDLDYINRNIDAAIAEAKASSDPQVRMDAMHRAEDIIMDQDWALGPIYFYTQKYMLNSDISGMYYTPLGYFFFDGCTKG